MIYFCTVNTYLALKFFLTYFTHAHDYMTRVDTLTESDQPVVRSVR